MATQFVGGTQRVLNNMMLAKSETLREIAEAVEKSAVDVANHAKAGHEGNRAHMNKRYQNQTGNLTQSIRSALTKVGFDLVEAATFTSMEYAVGVELGTSRNRPYPFLWPALLANQESFKERLKAVL